MAPDVQPLPESERLLVRRYDAHTRRVTLLLAFGPLAGMLLVGWWLGPKTSVWPYNLLGIAYVVLTWLGLGVWDFWRGRQFGRICPCPQCSGTLRANRRIGRTPPTTWLDCPSCGITWDSGGGHYDNRHPNDHSG
jgi:hypothetical protein